MYLTQVKAVLSSISDSSYYRFLGSTPFKIAHGIYSQQINYTHTRNYRHTQHLESIWHV